MHTNKKIILSGILGISALLITGGVIYLCVGSGTEPPSPEDQTPEEKVKFLASDNFSELPQEAKQKYLTEAVQEGKFREIFRSSRELPEEERKKLRENLHPVFRKMMQERINKYFTITNEDERIAYLDKLIDEHEERGKRMRERMENMSQEEREEMKKRHERRRGGPSLDRIKNRIESHTPQERAQFTQFFMAMRARMAQRGISRHGPPH